MTIPVGTKTMQMKCCGWTVKFGRPLYVFGNRMLWKQWRANRNYERARSRRRRNYWLGEVLRLRRRTVIRI